MCLSKVDLSNYNKVGLLLDKSNSLIKIYSCTQKLVILQQYAVLGFKNTRITLGTKLVDGGHFANKFSNAGYLKQELNFSLTFFNS